MATGDYAAAILLLLREFLDPAETSSLHRLGPWRRRLPFGSAFFHRRVADIQVVSLFPFIPLKEKAETLKPQSELRQKKSPTASQSQQGAVGAGLYPRAQKAGFLSQSEGGRGSGHSAWCAPRSAPGFPTKLNRTHLFFFQPLLLSLNELLDCHVNELVLCLRLHHARALPAYHLDSFGDVDIAVQACSR